METVALIRNGARANALASMDSVRTDRGSHFADIYHDIPSDFPLPRVRPEDFAGETLAEKVIAANEYLLKFPGGRCEFYFGATAEYNITQAIVLPSKTILKIDGCTIKMGNNIVDNLIRSSNIIPDPQNPTGAALNADTMTRCHDIKIIGVNGATLVMEDSASQSGAETVGWRGNTICLAGVSGFEVSGLYIKKNICWGINICACEYGFVKDIHFETTRQNGDGVDIGQSHDVYVEHIYGSTYDDIIAIHTFGRNRYTRRPVERTVPIVPYTYDLKGFAGPTYNVGVKNVHAYCVGTGNGLILLPGDYEIYNVSINDVSDEYNGTARNRASVIKIYGNEYTGGSSYELMHDVFINGIYAKAPTRAAVWLSLGIIRNCQINYVRKTDGISTLLNESGVTLTDYDFSITNVVVV